MLEKGTVINGMYQIMEQVGKGGGGTVYKAYHLNLQKEVAVKRINDSWKNIMDSRKESDIIKFLKHQYLPQAYDFVEMEDGIYTVMDFISGYSLDKYLNGTYHFSQQQVIRWTRQLTEALVYLHSQKPPIIHSDIKPANIMITREGNVCLIDFNVSLVAAPGNYIRATSRGYASPEHSLNVQPINQPVPNQPFVPLYHFGMTVPLDARSDIYSLGATLYHIVTHNRPPVFPEKLQPIPYVIEGYDDAFINIINKMICFDPNERYQSAKELLKDLNNIKKIDKQYLRHRRARFAVNTIFPAIMVGAVLLSLGGKLKMESEAVETFDNDIVYANNCVKNGQYDEAEKYYNEAMGINSESIEPYSGMLSIYSDKGEFEAAVKYGTDTLAQHNFTEKTTEKQKADFDYMIANAYFEQEDYNNAIVFYKKTTDLYQGNPEYYRDYAIALARTNEKKKKKSVLSIAQTLHLETDSVELVNAEIAYAEGNYSESVGYFKNAVSQSKSTTLTQRGYLYLCRAYQMLKRYDDVIDVLTKNENLFDDVRKKTALKMCAEAYVNKAQETADTIEKENCCKKAIELYTKIKSAGLVTKETNFNLAIAYETMGDFDNARAILNEMTSEYPDDSSVYARLAILEADEQELVEPPLRNYDKFIEYYNKAIELNKKNEVNGTGGSYIAYIQDLKRQLTDKNYIKENTQ